MSNMAGENTDCTHNTLGYETTGKLSSLRNENTSSVISFDGLGPNLNSKDNINNHKHAKLAHTSLRFSQQASVASVFKHERFKKTRPQAYKKL